MICIHLFIVFTIFQSQRLQKTIISKYLDQKYVIILTITQTYYNSLN